MFWLLLPLAAAGEMTIAVPPGTDAVRLVCGSAPAMELPAVGGVVTTTVDPSKTCEVELIQKSGQIKLWGEWSCAPGRCEEQQGAVTALSPGEVKITISEAFNATMLELNCRGGYRERVAISGYQGSFASVPEGDDCTLSFKGGAPGQYRGITPGVWQCDKQGTAVFCKQK